MNTMYSSVAERGREIATMRALGFGAAAVVISFSVEALLISFVGGGIACLAVLPLNGLTTSTMNFQTFSNLAFAFKITPELLAKGIDRKSTRLNSSHANISYAVFCLKKT